MHVQENITLGGVKLSNRFLLAPVKTALNSPGGKATQEVKAFCRRIAEGGVALLILDLSNE